MTWKAGENANGSRIVAVAAMPSTSGVPSASGGHSRYLGASLMPLWSACREQFGDLGGPWSRRAQVLGTAGGQPAEQAVPLRVKVVGAASLAVHVPWTPKVALPPGGIVAL